MKRNRFVYILLLIIVLIAGISSRKIDELPEFIQKYAGDTLWALFVYLLFAIVLRKSSSTTIALLSITFSFLIELSQLYHNQFIDNIRSTAIGALVLGFGFLWSDLVCYSVGVLIGYLGEKISGKLILSEC